MPSDNSSFPFPVIFVLFVIVVVIAIVYSIYAAKKRREEMAALAASLGLSYSPGDPFDIPSLYSEFNWISQGHNRSASNVIYGSLDGMDIKAFDYEYYTTETTRDSEGRTRTEERRHSFSAVAVDLDVVLTPMEIRPEGFFDRVAGAFGFDDIDFESNEFSRKFHVTSQDKRFAYDVIHPRMMEYLLANIGWSVQMRGRSVMIYTGGDFSVLEFQSAIEFVRGFFKQFPEYLWQKLRTQ